jgi:hypothetical protein
MKWLNNLLNPITISHTDAEILKVKAKYGKYFAMMEDVNFEMFLKLKSMEQVEIDILNENRPCENCGHKSISHDENHGCSILSCKCKKFNP